MIYLMRHGEIKGAEVRRYIGTTNVDLGSNGIKQARQWNRALQDIHFDTVLSSPLDRAVKTAQIVSGLPEPSVETVPELMEIHLGEWDGRTVADIRQRFPDAWKERGEDIAGYKPPKGESFRDLSQRVLPAFQKIAAQHVEKQVLLVAHAGVNRTILAHLLEIPLENLFQISQAYGALNLIKCLAGRLNAWQINLLPDNYSGPDRKPVNFFEYKAGANFNRRNT